MLRGPGPRERASDILLAQLGRQAPDRAGLAHRWECVPLLHLGKFAQVAHRDPADHPLDSPSVLEQGGVPGKALSADRGPAPAFRKLNPASHSMRGSLPLHVAVR